MSPELNSCMVSCNGSRNEKPFGKMAESGTMTEHDLVAPSQSRISASDISSRSDMMWIPGGTFRMGSDRHYAEEAPSIA